MKDSQESSRQLKVVSPNLSKIRDVTQPHFTWIGHATNYYQTNGVFFLTDPVWSERTSPISFMGPKRYVKPPIKLEDLHIDIVLLTHTHYDHLDRASARAIGDRALWCVRMQ